MSERVFNLLFLCTGNSARSIIAEATLATLAKGRFRAFSAGSFPSGTVQPMAADIALSLGYPAENLRSKSWDEFAGPDAPVMDFIITVCDNAANEVCPVWPGHPMTAHWGVSDPVTETGSEVERQRAYMTAYTVLRRRIELLLALPQASLESLSAETQVRQIGQTR